MKKKKTETESNKKEKGKKKKNLKVKKEEDTKDNKYEEYRIEKIDLVSQSSEEDIETKMKKLIELKKKGVNLDEYNKNEIDKIQCGQLIQQLIIILVYPSLTKKQLENLI